MKIIEQDECLRVNWEECVQEWGFVWWTSYNAGQCLMTASTSFRGDKCADSLAASSVQFSVTGCDWLGLVFTSPLVGLCHQCRSCRQNRMRFSIALYHKSYNDIYTDWSLYHKFVAKISAQTMNIKKDTLIRTQAPELLLYMPACIQTHIHTST